MPVDFTSMKIGLLGYVSLGGKFQSQPLEEAKKKRHLTSRMLEIIRKETKNIVQNIFMPVYKVLMH